jgi:hypothetical protein
VRLALLGCAFLCLLSSSTEGQQRHADSLWGAALLRVRPGTTIRLHSTALPGRVEGRLVGSTPSMVSLTVGVQPAEYARTAIDSLWVRRRATGTGALVGAIPGAIAGTVLGAVVNAVACSDDGGDPCPEAVPLLGLAGAATGAVLGAVVGSFIPKWQRRLP